MPSIKARQLRRTMTTAEQRLWSILRNRQLGGHKFRRQFPFDCYVLDFACLEQKLAVEADGGQHVDDHARDAVLAANGWRVLRFWNQDILANLPGVAETILGAMNSPLPQAGEGGAHAQHGRVREPSAPRPPFARLSAALAEHGLIMRGGLVGEFQAPGLQLPHPAAAPPPSPASGRGFILLIGTAGSAFWPHFLAARRDEPDPLDSWTRRVLTGIADRFGAQVLMPCDSPPFHPFQRWAMQAESVYPSPMGVLVHPVYGLWHAYRGALVFPEAIPLPPRQNLPNPCESCADRPCVSACPVHAAAPYDVPRCMDHLTTGGTCRTVGCLARHACPLGQGYAYGPEHAAFHMEAFVSAQW